MPLDSRLVSLVDQGHILDITLENLDFRVYVALRDANVEEVAGLVPPERFELGEVHVMAIGGEDDAPAQVQDALFNLNPGDTLVFLCTDEQGYGNTLAEFGQAP